MALAKIKGTVSKENIIETDEKLKANREVSGRTIGEQVRAHEARIAEELEEEVGKIANEIDEAYRKNDRLRFVDIKVVTIAAENRYPELTANFFDRKGIAIGRDEIAKDTLKIGKQVFTDFEPGNMMSLVSKLKEKGLNLFFKITNVPRRSKYYGPEQLLFICIVPDMYNKDDFYVRKALGKDLLDAEGNEDLFYDMISEDKRYNPEAEIANNESAISAEVDVLDVVEEESSIEEVSEVYVEEGNGVNGDN